MHKIMPAITNTLMDTRQNLVGFAPGLTGLRGSGLFPACLRQRFLILSKESRILHERAVTEGREFVKPYVNADALIGRRKGNGFVLTDKADEPFTSKAVDSGGLGSVNQRTVNDTLNLTYLGDLNVLTLQSATTLVNLRECQTIISSTPFIARVSRLLSALDTAEEGLKGEFYSFRNVLQNLRMNAFKFRVRRFPLSNVVVLRVTGKGLTLCFIECGSLSDKAVIDLTANIQRF